jgi:hypothetical protein
VVSFLDLPAELRFHIYALVAIPTAAPFSTYCGLYLSCKQVKNELDSEGHRVLQAHMVELSALKLGIQVSTTTAFRSPQHLHVFLDPAIYPGEPMALDRRSSTHGFRAH